MIYFNLFLLMLTGAAGFLNGNPMEPIDNPIELKPINENYSHIYKCHDDIGPEDCVSSDS